MIQLGSVLQDTYRLDRLLGKGGMGAVYQASHVRLPKQFAIKVMHAEVLSNREAYNRFRREAEISSSLGHPNIIEVQDFNETADGEPYIVMELLTGVDLAQVLARDGRFQLERALHVTRALVSALSAVHSVGVIHRDLKPQNVFLGRRSSQEIIKVLDFGISKISGSTDIQTKTSALIGTPAYMSPEQARGKSNLVDHRSDQFALGAMVYEMLAGRRAFVSDGDDVVTTLYRVLNEDPAPLGEPELPSAINDVLLRAMSKTPDERFPDVNAFMRALEDAAQGKAVQGRTAASTAPPGVLSSQAGAPISSLSAAASEVGRAPDDDEAPARSKTGLFAGAGLFAAAALVGAVMFVGKSKPAPLPPVAPVAAVQPAAPAAPTKVALHFQISPPGARVAVDGVPLQSPYLELPRGTTPSMLHAELDGYEPVTVPVSTDKDQTINIKLLPKTTAAPPTPPIAKPATHHSSSHASAKPTGKKPAAPVNKGEVLEDPFSN